MNKFFWGTSARQRSVLESGKAVRSKSRTPRTQRLGRRGLQPISRTGEALGNGTAEAHGKFWVRKGIHP